MMSAQPPTLSETPSDNHGKRRLCLGGSFDPIHLGHLITARAAAEACGLPGVRLIPAAANPHKTTRPIAGGPERLAMCRLAIADDPFFIVDPIELDRPPPSYTIDTVTAIAGDSGLRIPWLIGSDLLARLPAWHRFDALLDRVEFVVMRRAGYAIDLAGLDDRVIPLARKAVEVPQVEISATAIRERIKRGEPLDSLVPPVISEFIETHHLYV